MNFCLYSDKNVLQFPSILTLYVVFFSRVIFLIFSSIHFQSYFLLCREYTLDDFDLLTLRFDWWYRICLGEWSRGILKGYTLVRWTLIMPVGSSCCPCSFLFFNVNIQSNMICYGIFMCLWCCTLFFLIFLLILSPSLLSLLIGLPTIPIMLLLDKMIFLGCLHA